MKVVLSIMLYKLSCFAFIVTPRYPYSIGYFPTGFWKTFHFIEIDSIKVNWFEDVDTWEEEADSCFDCTFSRVTDFRVEENELSLFFSFIFVAAIKYDDKK